ncbi:MAG: hypothetical protein ACR2P1_02550 [Pseudomonadales bacterium]
MLINLVSGFDHNWVLNDTSGELREVATAKSLLSGIELSVLTTQPGLQFYTGNHLQAAGFKQHAAFCFETQHFPNLLIFQQRFYRSVKTIRKQPCIYSNSYKLAMFSGAS